MSSSLHLLWYSGTSAVEVLLVGHRLDTELLPDTQWHAGWRLLHQVCSLDGCWLPVTAPGLLGGALETTPDVQTAGDACS